MTKAAYIAVVIVIIIVIICLVVWWMAEACLFWPIVEMTWKPKIAYKDLWIDVYHGKGGGTSKGDGKGWSKRKENGEVPVAPCINAWYFDSFEGANTILFCHGNAGNISQRDYVINICQTYRINLLLIDYRGFGRSPGVPTTAGVCQDGIAAYNYLRSSDGPNLHSSQIVVWGESLGGAVATHIAYKNDCRCLVLHSTFSSIDDAIIYSKKIKFGKSSLAWLATCLIDTMPSKEKLRHVKCPVAVVHSKEDELIDYHCAEILYDSIKSSCRKMITIKGAHSAPDFNNRALARLFRFVDVSIDSCAISQDSTLRGISHNLRTVATRHFNHIERERIV